jgi:hypothetical protein
MSEETRKRRWYHPTPDRFLIGLLVVQVFLFLSDRFQWFALHDLKGWTVLIAIGVTCFAVLVLVLRCVENVVLRRRIQFGFRSLLLFLVVVSLPLGWFAWEMQRARRQREAVEAINMAGGMPHYGHPKDVNSVFSGALYFELRSQRWLGGWLGDDFTSKVSKVETLSRYFGDNDLTHVGTLTELRTLVLDHSEVTDAGLVHLKGLTNLEDLSLNNTRVTSMDFRDARCPLCWLRWNAPQDSRRDA